MTISMVGSGGALMNSPRRWDFLATIMLEMKFETFVEVGCKEGRTTGFILKNVPGSRVIAIDPWMKQEASEDKTKETYEGWDFGKIEHDFWQNVGEARKQERCDMLRMTSQEAAERVGDRQYDLVFIDALHDYEHVMQDISLWWPKVRKGGVLAGHDFNHKWPGVERAVADHFNLADIGIGFDSVWFIVKS